jgi:hypothetical protein
VFASRAKPDYLFLLLFQIVIKNNSNVGFGSLLN